VLLEGMQQLLQSRQRMVGHARMTPAAAAPGLSDLGEVHQAGDDVYVGEGQAVRAQLHQLLERGAALELLHEGTICCCGSTWACVCCHWPLLAVMVRTFGGSAEPEHGQHAHEILGFVLIEPAPCWAELLRQPRHTAS
jgi:hypothetical protein